MSESENEQNEYSFESEADLVIGIDFGTTFSGVAWAHAASITSTDKKVIVDKVNVIRGWPGHGQADKIPSVIAYNTSPPSWGFRVKATEEKRVAHFKLGLQRNLRDHYLSAPVPKTSILGGYLTETNWRHPLLSDKKAIDFVADYLTGVCNYVSKESLTRHYGPDFLKMQRVSFVITVPAIWRDEAKELTKQAADRAGIPRRRLTLITEPEAAALYCDHMQCEQADLKLGDGFVICDAGGGTVVSHRFT
jgi:molecular chaperone DnaK (HSP70)